MFHILLIFIAIIDYSLSQYLVEVLERTAFGGHRAVVRCDATGANFGEDVSQFSSAAPGCAHFTSPSIACSDVRLSNANTSECIGARFAVVPRGNCSFSEKAYYAQHARPLPYHALIIYNYPTEPLITMAGGKYADDVLIPVVMISYTCMQSIMGRYSAEHGYTIAIKVAPGYYDLVKYLVPFVAVVGFCFIILVIAFIVRLCREHRRVSRRRLSRSGLRKIPTRKYKKGEEPETCAICLEDFIEGEKLRILPCRHAYHCKCVDPWLTKNRKVCPVCKRKVGTSGDDSSDSDAERNAADTAAGRRERSPLLNSTAANPGRQVGNSTFFPNYQSTEDELIGSMILSPTGSPRSRLPAPPSIHLSRTHQSARSLESTTEATVHTSNSDLMASAEMSSSTEHLIPSTSTMMRLKSAFIGKHRSEPEGASDLDSSAASTRPVDRGIENNGFSIDSDQLLLPTNRKRHPAARGSAADFGPISMHDDDDSDGIDQLSRQTVGGGFLADHQRSVMNVKPKKRLTKRAVRRGGVSRRNVNDGSTSRYDDVAASAPPDHHVIDDNNKRLVADDDVIFRASVDEETIVGSTNTNKHISASNNEIV